MKGKILVTGGTGYIGSHTCVELLNNNDEVNKVLRYRKWDKLEKCLGL